MGRRKASDIRNAIRYGGDQALAASRGEGKTKIFERMLLKYTFAGVIKFSVLFAATGSSAQDSLQSIMGEIETNERLRADYPEVCVPVLALENTRNRAHYQLVTGKRHDNGAPYQAVPSRFSWCGQEIVLPDVPGSPSAGAIIATRGLDAAVRGLNKRDRRVDVAGIDEPRGGGCRGCGRQTGTPSTRCRLTIATFCWAVKCRRSRRREPLPEESF